MNKRDLLKKIYNLKNNIIVSGRINSRKTYGVMFPFVEVLMENNESFLVLDSKEEYLKRFYGELGERGYETVVINLRDSLKSDGWNPLTYAYSLYSNNHIDEATRSIEKIAYILFDGQGDPYWTISAKNLFLGLVWFLFENASEEEINFNSIVELLDLFKDKEYLFENFEGEESRSSMLLNPIIRTSDDTKNSIISVVRQSLSIYTNYPNLSRLLATPMKELHLDRKFAIFLINRDEDLYFNALAAIFIDQFYDFLMKKRYDTSFNFILDNFETIAKDYPNANILLSSGPSRKVRTIIGSNETFDYYDDYSESIRSTEETVYFKMDNEEYSVPNDYERVDLNQEVNYPTLNKEEIKTFNVCPCCHGGECTCNGECHCGDECTCDSSCNCGCHEGKECTCGDECTCKNCTCDKKESFNDFIKNNEFDDLAVNISISELTRSIDEEIERLNEQLNDDIPDDEEEISKVIRKIDEEIANLEKQNKEDTDSVYNVRDNFNSLLSNNSINNVDTNNVDVDFTPIELEELTTRISEEIQKLDEELNDDIPDDEEEVQKLVNKIEGEISRLEDSSNDESVKQVRSDFQEFLDKNDFEEYEPVRRNEFDDLIKSIDKQIEMLESNYSVSEKNDFEKFLEENSFDDIVESIKDEDFDDNVTYDQLIEALDKEIAVLEEKVNNKNKENFDDIIKRIDDEIARLEREEMINPDISDTRESYDEMISKIDDEIARLEKEQAAIDRNKFDFNEIERLNREIDEELNKLSEDVVPEEEISDDNEGTSRVIEIK
ncbi:MAG: hypothetical protein J6X02_03255 [Bacilli bacterium]|nr:hypothetical protein [Bacilli bacterium]